MADPGLLLFRSILDSGSQTTFRQCLPVWFSPEEAPVYDFLNGFISRHGRMPSMETLRENGINLPRATEPPAYYVDRVRKRAIFAQLDALHPEFLQAIGQKDMDGALRVLQAMQRNSNAVNTSSELTNIREQSQRVLEQYEQAHRSFRLIGVPLGWDCVDAVTEGAHAGDVVILVGRPNVGKTYGLLWMLKKAWMDGKSILICSMEMAAEQITRRVIGLQSGLNPKVIRSGRLSTWGENLMRNTVEGFDDMPPLNIITGNFRKKVSDIDKAAQELQPDIIFVDAGYLLTADKTKGGGKSRREVISDVIEELKAMAIDRQRPLVTSVQFNREVKRVHRGDLDLSSIGETDVIAQIATIVLGMRYGDAPNEHRTRRWELIKNRDGELLKFETNFSFAPVDLSFNRMLTDDEVADTQSGPDLSHMV